MFRDKPVLEFETDLETFTEIIQKLYKEHGDAIGFSITNKEYIDKLDKGKTR